MSKKRMTGGIITAAMAVNCLVAMPFSASAVDTVRYEAEEATIIGVAEKATEVSGYSGTGYVNMTDNEQTPLPAVTFTVNVEEAGNYGLTIGYATTYGAKHLEIEANGKAIDSVSLEASKTFTEMTLKAPLNAGENTITLTASWGWMQIDYIEIGEYVPPARPEISAAHTAPCDTQATPEVRQLMTYLSSVYGKNIISGQQEIYNYGPHDFEHEFEYIYEKTGKYPAIRGFDYLNEVNPLYGAEDGTTDRMIDWANNRGGIVTASWHITVPNNFSSYNIGDAVSWDNATYDPKKTDFDTANVIVEGTKEYEYYQLCLKQLAEKIQKLQDANVPIIFRPLHEAEGGGGESGSWFWWGKAGSAVYRELWKMTYKTLTEEYGLHNIIWEWNSYNFSTSANWYPGDEYVDIIGYDKYNCTVYASDGSPSLVHNDSAIPDIFYGIMGKFNNAKMLAMAECDSFSTVGNLTTEQAGWLYFCPWYDGGRDDINFLSNPMFNTEQDLIDMYTSDYCITLDELPKFSEIEYDPEAVNTPINEEPEKPEDGHAMISVTEKGEYKIDLPEASDTIYLVIEMPDEETYANGGLGVSIEIDGHYYWTNIQWEAEKSGEVELKLVDHILNVTEGTVVVTDEAIISQVKEKLSSQKSFTGQIWHAENTEASKIKITDAYIKKEETPTESDSTEPTDTVSTIKGDVDCNGKINILDVIALNRAILGREDLNEQQNKNADINGDGTPSSDDALQILKAIVGLITLE